MAWEVGKWDSMSDSASSIHGAENSLEKLNLGCVFIISITKFSFKKYALYEKSLY